MGRPFCAKDKAPMNSSRLGVASRAALSEGGDLARALPAFAPRPAQQDLSAAIADAFEGRGVLLAEAGTGTGKTFAYLVPAILSGHKTIISTGTRALQDQLYHRDLPRVRDALGKGLKTALLKGRANYLCHYRLQQAKGEGRFATREHAAQFQRIVAWAGRTRMGDLAEMDGIAEDSLLWPMVTSTAENCLGSECPFFSECFVVQARQRAQAADIVVVNHHLLLADLALKQEGFGEILPGAQAFVVDEAHQLPDLAAQFFGESLSARPLVELARDAVSECKTSPGALAVVQEPARALEHAVRGLRAAMDDLPVRATRRRAAELPAVEEALAALEHALATLHAALLPVRESAPGLDSCTARAREFELRLQRWRALPSDVEEEADPFAADFSDLDAERGAGAGSGSSGSERVASAAVNYADAASPACAVAAPADSAGGPVAPSMGAEAPAPALGEAGGDADTDADADSVRWYELTAKGFRLTRTPLDVAGPLAKHRAQSQAAWVFTSATLAIGGRFEHFAIKLGLSASWRG